MDEEKYPSETKQAELDDDDMKPFLPFVPPSDSHALNFGQPQAPLAPPEPPIEKCPCSISLVFVLMVASCIGFGYVLYYYTDFYPRVMLVLFGLMSWAISLCFHEFGHAIVGYYGGDVSVKEKGYLTFDPTKYTTIMGSIIIPLIFLLVGGLGLPGGAVYVATGALRSRLWETAVSLAGPVMTLLCAFACAAPFYYMDEYEREAISQPFSTHKMFWAGMAFNVFIQFSALILNMIPLPPFDGWGAILPWLPECIKEMYYRNAQMAGLVCTVLVFLAFYRFPESMDFIVNFATDLGVPLYLVSIGASAFQLF